MLSLDHGDLYRKFLLDRSTSLIFRCRKYDAKSGSIFAMDFQSSRELACQGRIAVRPVRSDATFLEYAQKLCENA